MDVRLPSHAWLVDDDPLDAALLIEALAKIGVPASHCPDFEIPDFVEREGAPELVVFDLDLGAQSGLELVSDLRRAGDDRPVMIATGGGDERTAIECIRAGADDYVGKGDLEAAVLRRAVLNAVAQWGRRRAERARQDLLESLAAANRRLDRLAMEDELTGLLNRRGFHKRLDAAIGAAERFGHSLVLILLDLDDFKQVNDHAGHAEGDRVLQELGSIVSRLMRRSDFAARMGGDEFAICIERATATSAKTLALRLLGAIGELTWGDGAGRIGCSMGLAELQEEEDAASVHIRADEALYTAKRAGGHRVDTAPATRTDP